MDSTDQQDFEQAVDAALDQLTALDAINRLWRRDGSLFSDDLEVQRKVRDRLGWLFSPPAMRESIERLTVLARTVERQGYQQVVVVGMGGSSLWPEVIGRHLAGRRGLPIRVADSTHPAAVADLLESARRTRTLFLIATKSGGTIETVSLYRALRSHFPDGRDYVAITDPGSSLEELARIEGFRDVFLGLADVGGRFSALSPFGLVPAVLAGVVVHDALERAMETAADCREPDPRLNPAARLAAVLAAGARTGRWQMRLVLGRDVRAFGGWIEQLIAESTGKAGQGILPVLGALGQGGTNLGAALRHAIVVGLSSFDHPDDDFAADCDDANVPGLRFVMPEVADLWTEVFRWEAATALVGVLSGINPFDEPDVSAAKAATAALLTGARQPATPDRELRVRRLVDIDTAIGDSIASLPADDYLAVLAFVAPDQGNLQRLETLRERLQARTAAAVVVAIGPRYLHSTGQLHKGGPPRGHFIVAHDLDRVARGELDDVPIPGADHGFATLIRAQAEGDVAVLAERGLPVTLVHVG